LRNVQSWAMPKRPERNRATERRVMPVAYDDADPSCPFSEDVSDAESVVRSTPRETARTERIWPYVYLI
jgi:hypothetical protein